MTTHKEEQLEEIEALKAIYCDEINVLSEKPVHVFEVSVKSNSSHDEAENVECVLHFAYTERYPETAPRVELQDLELGDCHVTALNDVIAEQIEENKGTPLVFCVVSAVQERLGDIVTQLATQQVEERERRVRAEEEATQKKFEGTCCTIETFLAWKEKFDAEMAEKRRLAGLSVKKTDKLTGKQLFLADDHLDDSDVRFLEADGGAAARVEVDESLFDDVDELDLEDDS